MWVRGRAGSAVLATSIMAAAALTVAMLAGCAAGSDASQAAAGPAGPAIPLGAGSAGPGLRWAMVRTGGPQVGGRYWQLLVQDQATGKWRLVTPPGVADNAGLAVATASAAAMTVGFIPSQLLRFSPLAITTDGGGHWTPGLLPAGLVGDPGALATMPNGRLIAVTAKGAEESAAGASGWVPLETLRALAATTAGRSCGLTALTGAVAGPGGAAMLAGTCREAGMVGLFMKTADGWQSAGLRLPRSLGARSVSVLRLTGLPTSVLALLSVATGGGDVVVPALLSSGRWAVGVPSVKVSGIESVATTSTGGWDVVFGGRYAALGGLPSGQTSYYNLTRRLKLPASGAALLPVSSMSGPGARLTVLVPHVTTVTVEQLTSSGWRTTQVIKVPVAPQGQQS
ncbi:MAG TPA: hypothetical protein VMR14_20270 [Streptosporangiaceae bacterium]|nr:hypothetical protein [Streptosporangiaceae bacterium]